MHRLILGSAVYQQASSIADFGSRISDSKTASPQAVDPNNRLLWRMPLRRLDAESLRDAMLAVSGRLDRAVGGDDSGEFLFREGELIDRARDFFRPNRVKGDHPYYTTSVRRSLYLPVVRNAVPDVLALFDAADPNSMTAVRNDTTVPSQALFLLNHPFVREQSLHFARRLLDGPKSTAADRVRTAYPIALGREASADEVTEAVSFLGQYEERATAKGRRPEEARLAAWQSFCQAMLCRNEFLYVE
jgi:hypothetical protein